jgi:hypothetical protein
MLIQAVRKTYLPEQAMTARRGRRMKMEWTLRKI